jgi:hypothetical protein
MTKEQVLRAAGELLKDPKNRITGHYRRVESDGTCRYCLAGALGHVAPPGREILDQAYATVRKEFLGCTSVDLWDNANLYEQESIVQWLLTFPEESQ